MRLYIINMIYVVRCFTSHTHTPNMYWSCMMLFCPLLRTGKHEHVQNGRDSLQRLSDRSAGLWAHSHVGGHRTDAQRRTGGAAGRMVRLMRLRLRTDWRRHVLADERAVLGELHCAVSRGCGWKWGLVWLINNARQCEMIDGFITCTWVRQNRT